MTKFRAGRARRASRHAPVIFGTAEQLLRLSKLGQAASSPTMTKAFNL
jgi:hypothetical protein